MDSLISLYGFTLSRLEALSRDLGAPRYTARQLAEWMYRKDCRTFEAMTNLPKALRRELETEFNLSRPVPILGATSADGTQKYLLPLGAATAETAFIPEEKRATLCLSTQAGCRMGCRFCMTGKLGLKGNLTSGQILSQYAELPQRFSITNVVYMGMGEPLDNLEAVLDSLEILTSDWGYGLGHQRICVSTVGILPQLEEFLARSKVRLALSLHFPFEDERAKMMSCQRASPLSDVLETLKKLETGQRRRIYIEYILFNELNDSPRHAKELARILHGLEVRVNLITFHSVPQTKLQPSPRPRMEEFQRLLLEKGIQTTIRKSRGEDIEAACGLLGSRATYAGY